MEYENDIALDIVAETGDYQDGNLILDIGCHAGDFVHACATRFGNSINIKAFEPDENNYSVIMQQVSNYPKCEVIKKAIFYSDKSEARVLGTGDGSIGGYMVSLIETDHVNSWMFPSLHEYNGKVFSLSRLEDFCDSAWLAKLDCEASEWNIIENSTTIKNTKHLIVEFHNHDMNYALEFLKKHLPNHQLLFASNRHIYLRKKH
jgi:FkbM family methyltransferase